MNTMTKGNVLPALSIVLGIIAIILPFMGLISLWFVSALGLALGISTIRDSRGAIGAITNALALLMCVGWMAALSELNEINDSAILIQN